jgi:hypothetical protein
MTFVSLQITLQLFVPRQDDSARGRNNAGQIELTGLDNGLAEINKQRHAISLPILGNKIVF